MNSLKKKLKPQLNAERGQPHPNATSIDLLPGNQTTHPSLTSYDEILGNTIGTVYNGLTGEK